ncbi:cation:proton antiporter [Dellaglioa sp. BT-FLS60]
MGSLFAILLLLSGVVIANVIAIKFSKVPQAFYQIGIGLGLSLLPNFQHFELKPELFFILIVAPLIFNEAQNTSRRSLAKNILVTLSLAIVLVGATIIVTGFLAHTILPALSLTLAFALAAIVTPTDTVAVSSVTKNLPIPESTMNILENESLFNDASGIVGLSLALTAFSSGTFSINEGLSAFSLSFFGGLFIGALLGLVFVRIRLTLLSWHIEDTAVMIPIELITPFLIYFVSEELGCSGILAVVAAGLIHGVQKDRLRLSSTKLQFVSSSLWKVLTDALNGFVFVVLGLTLPTVTSDLLKSSGSNALILFAISIGIYIIMTLMRLLWSHFLLKTPSLKDDFTFALSGIHGTITLSMAYSLPLTTNSGSVFPMRNEIIFISALVILISMLVPTFLLPHLIPKKNEITILENIGQIRSQMVVYTVEQLNVTNLPSPERQTVIETLYNQQNFLKRPERSKFFELIEKTQEIEENVLHELLVSGQVSEKMGIWYEKYLETTYQSTRGFSLKNLIMHLFFYFLRFFKSHTIKKRKKILSQITEEQKKAFKNYYGTSGENTRAEFNLMEASGYQAAITYLTSVTTSENSMTVTMVRQFLSIRHRRSSATETQLVLQNNIFISAFQLEYNFVQLQLEQNLINPTTANLLREQISYDEMVYIQNNESFSS